MSAMTAEDYQRLMEEEEFERVIPVPGWGDVRLVKTGPAEFLEMITFQEPMEKHPKGHPQEGEVVHNSDAVRFAAKLLSITIHDDQDKRPYDNQKGRVFLSRLSLPKLQVLANAAIDLCKLGPGQIDTHIDQAKKN
jgi:hypothetical protein